MKRIGQICYSCPERTIVFYLCYTTKIHEMASIDLAKYLPQSIDYNTYENTLQQIAASGDDSIRYLQYIILNAQRMQRLYKTTTLDSGVITAAQKITQPQYWLVLTEAWCGDAAQSIPVIAKIAEQQPLITLRFLWRDQNPELMDQFLTDGKSRSIPKLIATDATGKVLFDWGPRPAPLQKIFHELVASGVQMPELAERLQKWYVKDKTRLIQEEIGTRISD